MIERGAGRLALAFLRYLPGSVLPALTPMRWAPPLVRIVLALGLAWLTVLAMPKQMYIAQAPINWGMAAFGELTVGLVFGLVVVVPSAALHVAGWVVEGRSEEKR